MPIICLKNTHYYTYIMSAQVSKSNEDNTFNSWFFGSTEMVEKTISLVVLSIEIALLFFHTDSDSYYIFTGLNLFFSFFIYLTLSDNGKILSVMKKRFKTTSEEDELKIKNNDVSQADYDKKKAERDNYLKLLRQAKLKYVSLKKQIKQIPRNLDKEDKNKVFYERIKEEYYQVKDLKIRLEQKCEEINKDKTIIIFDKIASDDGANIMIEQFKSIKYAWLFTSLLYALFMLEHFLNEHPYQLLIDSGPIKKILADIDWQQISKLATAALSLIGVYYYIVAYYVMYYPTLGKSGKGTEKIQYRNTMWWWGVIVSVLILYASSYGHDKSYQELHGGKIIFESNNYPGDSVILIGSNCVSNSSRAVFLSDQEHISSYSVLNATRYRMGAYTPDSMKIDTSKRTAVQVASLIINLDTLHKRDLVIIDSLHSSIELTSVKGNAQSAHFELVANGTGALDIKACRNVKDATISIRSSDNAETATDFAFLSITGLLSALALCFFVARFESITFKTPPWVLMILYMYAVIQGFLVILDPDFIKQNELLKLTQHSVTQIVYFLALVGKITLYIYILGTFSTKRLFYYFKRTHIQIEEADEKWHDYLEEVREYDVLDKTETGK